MKEAKEGGNEGDGGGGGEERRREEKRRREEERRRAEKKEEERRRKKKRAGRSEEKEMRKIINAHYVGYIVVRLSSPLASVAQDEIGTFVWDLKITGAGFRVKSRWGGK